MRMRVMILNFVDLSLCDIEESWLGALFLSLSLMPRRRRPNWQSK
jgi:hypothetical protein